MENCGSHEYIGFTRTTLSRRITMHLQNGALSSHATSSHGESVNREQIVSNIKIIRQEHDINRLMILEALYIKEFNPKINRQHTGKSRTLYLLGNDDNNYHPTHLINSNNQRTAADLDSEQPPQPTVAQTPSQSTQQ